MFKKQQKDLSTPADTHLIELYDKAISARKTIESRANTIMRLQKVDDLLPTCPEKTTLKERINKAKKELLNDFERYNTAVGDYQRYHSNTLDARVTTINYPDNFIDCITILYRLV